MEPHPDFAEVDWPRSFALDRYQLTPLSADQVDEDFAAVQATAPLLGGIFGNWPVGLTQRDNLIDLAWHDREFIARRSFSWILRDEFGTYIGCFYIFPDLGVRGRAKAALWLCDLPDREAMARHIKTQLLAWLAAHLPPRIDLYWETSPELEATS